jgi:hypothetical protein
LNTDSRENFTDLVLPDMPRLSEVIDAGDRSFEEFLKLLDRADRFKDWLKAVNPDEDLVRTYVREISSESWVQGLRGKSLRYVLASAIGASNPIAGLAAGFADTFLIDKLFSGWRPNHFVDGKLSSFVQTR